MINTEHTLNNFLNVEGSKLRYEGSKNFKLELLEANIITIIEKDEDLISYFKINALSENYMASFFYSVDDTRCYTIKKRTNS